MTSRRRCHATHAKVSRSIRSNQQLKSQNGNKRNNPRPAGPAKKTQQSTSYGTPGLGSAAKVPGMQVVDRVRGPNEQYDILDDLGKYLPTLSILPSQRHNKRSEKKIRSFPNQQQRSKFGNTQRVANTMEDGEIKYPRLGLGKLSDSICRLTSQEEEIVTSVLTRFLGIIV
jgi:hypothetical protein